LTSKIWRFGLASLTLILAFVSFLLSPLRGAICMSQFRLADELQQIEAALDYYVPSLSREFEFRDEQNKVRVIVPLFTTKENLKARFPNCCSVTSVSKSVGVIWDWEAWLTGRTVAFVNIVFDVGYRGDNGEVQTIHHYDQIPISSCGTVRSDVFTNPIGSVSKHSFGSPTQGMWN
jgi:hypothetical protein